MSANGPLGNLQGMFFDPITNRYYPIPRGGTAQTQTNAGPSRPAPSQAAGPSTPVARPRQLPRKRQKNDNQKTELESGQTSSNPSDKETQSTRAPLCNFTTAKLIYGQGGGGSTRPRGLRSRIMPSGSGSSSISRQNDLSQVEMYSNLELVGSADLVGDSHENEAVSHLTTFPTGALYVTTNHGRLIMQRPDRLFSDIAVCRAPLLGVHYNMARMSILSIAEGYDPHVHRISRDTGQPDQFKSYDDATLDANDAFCFSSHGDLCTIGATKQLITLDDNSDNLERPYSRRHLPSDPMAVHHYDHNIVYTGLRNSRIHAEDLRIRGGRTSAAIAKLQRGKAVIGIKRLKDSAVPYGLVASGMSNELLLFDVRYGDKPVFSLPGHHNAYLSNLGLATTFDDKHLFAAGSDSRIRAWSLTDGTRLQPTTSDPVQLGRTNSNPLTRIFDTPPREIQITESGLMDVGCGKNVFRFSKPTEFTHHPSVSDVGMGSRG